MVMGPGKMSIVSSYSTVKKTTRLTFLYKMRNDNPLYRKETIFFFKLTVM